MYKLHVNKAKFRWARILDKCLFLADLLTTFSAACTIGNAVLISHCERLINKETGSGAATQACKEDISAL